MKDKIKEMLDKYKNMEINELSPKQCNKLLDYITNLQNRIKELEEINKQHQELNGMLNQEMLFLKEEIEQWKKKYGNQ